MQTPLYTATVRLQIDRPAKIVESEVMLFPSTSDYEFMETQYELLRSRMMAERVVSSFISVTYNTPRRKAILFSAPSRDYFGQPRTLMKRREGALQQATVGFILGHVTVQPVTGSRLVDVSYSDPDPSHAQQIANAYADAFVGHQYRQALSGQRISQGLS